MKSIETQRLIIRELDMSDAKRLSEYRNKREVAYYQSWWRYSYNKAVKRIEYCLAHPFDGTKGSYQLGVVLKKNNYLIGDYFLEVIEPASVTVGYTFDSDFWHFGYATESFKVLLDILKNEYKFKRVFSTVLVSKNLVSFPSTAIEITPVSSLTMMEIASECSVIPIPALCLVPRLLFKFLFSVKGRTHPAA